MDQLKLDSSDLADSDLSDGPGASGLPVSDSEVRKVSPSPMGADGAPPVARSASSADQVLVAKDWAFLALNAVAILVAIYAVLQSGRSEKRSLRVEADVRLAKAWDLLGGEVGADEIGEASPERTACILANRELDSALTLWPEDPTAYRYKGVHARLCGHVEDSIEFYRKSIEFDPKQHSSHNSLGVALSQLGYGEEALEAYEEAIRLDPSYGLAYFNKGNLHKDNRKWSQAMDAYREAASNSYDTSELHMNMGLIFLENSDLVQAVACFRKSIALDSQAVGAHVGLGLALLQLDLRAEARRSCAAALEIAPDMALALTCVQRVDLAASGQDPAEAIGS